MTLREAYDYGQRQLKDVGIEDASFDAWYLLEYVTGISRTKYFLCMNETMEVEAEKKYEECLLMRRKHIPLQHITGVQEFMGLEFCVNEHVLIPRQDTEILVESVLKVLKSDMKVLDMCTGSGCIIISLAKHGGVKQGIGVDISEHALCVAKGNAQKHHADVKFLQSDLFSNVEGKYNIIVSNPPYIRTAVIGELREEVKFHDPVLALDGKEDGLYFYKRIVEESKSYLEPKGMLFFEIGHDQGEAVQGLMVEAGFQDVEVKKDLAGLDRVVFGVYNV